MSRDDDDGLGAARGLVYTLPLALCLWAILLFLLRELVLWAR